LCEIEVLICGKNKKNKNNLLVYIYISIVVLTDSYKKLLHTVALTQSSKWKFELTGPNKFLEFILYIYIYIYIEIKNEKFTGLWPEDPVHREDCLQDWQIQLTMDIVFWQGVTIKPAF
jgi:hypothetical protein